MQNPVNTSPFRARLIEIPILFLALILFSIPICAQQKGGVVQSAGSSAEARAKEDHSPQSAVSQTYAVVVGISDYQDPLIPDLQYADRDAEAFANFLRSPAGGVLDEKNLRLLTNQDATVAQFAMALDWLWEVAGEGDKAIIYFSGHGDVERKSITQPGYLLCWDAPHHPYMAGGAFNIRDLKDVVSTISVQNKARVILITDACRAGKLSGSNLGGAQATAASLTQQFANEIKILSCQPDEYSIEGEQWGGGRGAFSYHLLDGMYGLADANHDNAVSLMEIGRYLEDHVSIEVAPNYQMPMTVGNSREKLSEVHPGLLEQIRQDKLGQMQAFAAIETRGLAEDVMASVDSSIAELYYAFTRTLQAKVFLEPVEGGASDDYAEAYYQQMMAEPMLEPLHSSIRRNYAAALQDDAQQVLNSWLRAEIEEVGLSKITQTDKYRNYPHYLSRAAELLGPNHYMYHVLQARSAYFEGYLMHIDNRNAVVEMGSQVLAKYREALQWQEDLPHVYKSMSQVFFYQMLQPDSAELYAKKAVEAAPGWIMPYSSLSIMYAGETIHRNLTKTKHFLTEADKQDSTAARVNLFHMNNWANYYNGARMVKKAEATYQKMIQQDSTIAAIHNNLAMHYLMNRQPEAAKKQFLKSITLDSTLAYPFASLGMIYYASKKYEKAESYYRKAISLDPSNLVSLSGLATMLILDERYEEGESAFRRALAIDSLNAGLYMNTGSAYLNNGLPDKAIEKMELALQFNPDYTQGIAFLGYIYNSMERTEEAEIQFRQVLQIGLQLARDSQFHSAHNAFMDIQRFYKPFVKYAKVGFATIHGLNKRVDRAYTSLEKAFKNGYTLDDPFFDVLNDPALAPMRAETERWEALMGKYFPDRFD